MDFGNSLILDNGFRELKRVKKLRKKLRNSLTSSVCKIHSDHFKTIYCLLFPFNTKTSFKEK